MITWLIIMLVFVLNFDGCASVPVGFGKRVHICGTIVDENLVPVRDSLLITTRTSHPIMNISSSNFGAEVQSEGYQWTTNGNFCVDGYHSFGFTAHVHGKYVDLAHLSVGVRSLNISGYKWVVDRNPKMGKRPNFNSANYLSIGQNQRVGFSILTENELSSFDTTGAPFYKEWFQILNLRDGSRVPSVSLDSQIVTWMSNHPGSVRMTFDPYTKQPSMYELKPAYYLVDFELREHSDSLFIANARNSNTKFFPAYIDTPICNFGRLPGPEVVKNSTWQDSILISIRDTLKIDAFYVDFPWVQKWGKIILDKKIIRKKTTLHVSFNYVIKQKSDSSSFLFWRIPDEDEYTERAKCLTPVESMRTTEIFRNKWGD